MKRNDGFTLIELLVTISAGALVTFAAVSLLLLGARVQYATTQEAQEQQTVRIVMSLLENMAGSGDIKEIEATDTGWQLKDKDGDVLFEYKAGTQSIYRGLAEAEGNEPLLAGLNNAGAVMEGKVMRLSFETDRGANYVTRVYCRLGVEDDSGMTDQQVNDKVDGYKNENSDEVNVADSPEAWRWSFLNTLAGEYNGGQNTGKSPTTGEYYSHWYIGDAGWGKNGWNKDTPWCACFVSWAAVKNELVQQGSPFVFANVDAGMEAFDKAGKWKNAGSYIPTPGDYIFFDWTGQQKDPAHVGVVLDVSDENEDGYLDCIYTIEGNSSGRVAVRKYKIDDPVIMGYGVLPGF